VIRMKERISMKIMQQHVAPRPAVGSRSHIHYLKRQFDFFAKIPGENYSAAIPARAHNPLCAYF